LENATLNGRNTEVTYQYQAVYKKLVIQISQTSTHSASNSSCPEHVAIEGNQVTAWASVLFSTVFVTTLSNRATNKGMAARKAKWTAK
jgi:hypothetical protein